MKKKSYLCLEKFKNTQDYLDINYMIKHVNDTQVRASVIESLGYNVVRVTQSQNLGEGYLMFDKQGNLYMQIIPKYPNCNLARCVRFQPNDFKKWIKKQVE